MYNLVPSGLKNIDVMPTSELGAPEEREPDNEEISQGVARSHWTIPAGVECPVNNLVQSGLKNNPRPGVPRTATARLIPS